MVLQLNIADSVTLAAAVPSLPMSSEQAVPVTATGWADDEGRRLQKHTLSSSTAE